MPEENTISYHALYRVSDQLHEAIKQLQCQPSQQLERVLNWRDVLPQPDFSKNPESSFSIGGFNPRIPTRTECELTWQAGAEKFFLTTMQQMEQQKERAYRLIKEDVAPWNRAHPEESERLDPDKLYTQWLRSVDTLSLQDSLRLNIDKARMKAFIAPFLKEIREKYGFDLAVKTTQKSKEGRANNKETKNKAFTALAKFREKIEDVIKERQITDEKEIVHEAIGRWSILMAQLRIGKSTKSLDRYIEGERKEGNHMDFGRQLVRQIRSRK